MRKYIWSALVAFTCVLVAVQSYAADTTPTPSTGTPAVTSPAPHQTGAAKSAKHSKKAKKSPSTHTPASHKH
jgi:hypothetical protein